MRSAAGGMVPRDSGAYDSRSLLSVEERERKRQKLAMVDPASFSDAWNGADAWRPEADSLEGSGA